MKIIIYLILGLIAIYFSLLFIVMWIAGTVMYFFPSESEREEKRLVKEAMNKDVAKEILMA